jgi:hypothetical protein
MEPLGPVRQADRSGSLDSPDSPAKMGRGIQRRTANLRTSSQGEYRCCPSSSWLSSWLARASLIHRRRRRSAPLDRGQRPEYVSLNTFQVARQDGGSPVWWTFRVPASLLLEQHRCASNGHAYTIRGEFLVGFVVGKSRSARPSGKRSSARSRNTKSRSASAGGSRCNARCLRSLSSTSQLSALSLGRSRPSPCLSSAASIRLRQNRRWRRLRSLPKHFGVTATAFWESRPARRPRHNAPLLRHPRQASDGHGPARVHIRPTRPVPIEHV